MTRVSLVLGGGGSLGAYVGGAVTELLLAFERNRAREPLTVDVISASSAGALSAALAARSLMVNPSLIPWIERTWVDALGADLLLNPHRADRSALLDAAAVDDLTRPLIAGGPAADDRASPAAAPSLRVGFTLTRLGAGPRDEGDASDAVGAPGGRPVGPGEGPAASDRAVFTLTPGNGAGDPVWERVRSAALAAGAVPLVHAPRRLFPAEVADGDDGSGSAGAWYADGSVVGDRPLALARRLAADAGGGERIRILVDPTLARAEPPATAGGPSPGVERVIGLLAGGLLGRGAARELLDEGAAGPVGDRGEIFDALVARLPEINAGMDDPGAVGLGRRIGELAERVAERQVSEGGAAVSASSDPALDRLDAELTRIGDAPRYAPTLRRAETRAGRTRLGKLIYVLEAITASTDGGDPGLHVVTPGEDGLAGSFMGGFGGYLDEACRRHDFRAGRLDARELLESALGDRVAYDPDREEVYDPGRAPGSFDELPPAARRELRSFLEAEAGRLFDQLRPRGVGGLFYRISGRALRKAAARRLLQALREMP